MQSFAPEMEGAMKNFYNSLNEKDRRRYAGIEALKLGLGGRNYIARILGCSRRIFTQRAKEVIGCSARKQRCAFAKKEGGRKSYTDSWKGIDDKFLKVLREHTAGDPMDATIRWTGLTPKEIMAALREDHGIRMSQWVMRRLLKKQSARPG